MRMSKVYRASGSTSCCCATMFSSARRNRSQRFRSCSSTWSILRHRPLEDGLQVQIGEEPPLRCPHAAVDHLPPLVTEFVDDGGDVPLGVFPLVVLDRGLNEGLAVVISPDLEEQILPLLHVNPPQN